MLNADSHYNIYLKGYLLVVLTISLKKLIRKKNAKNHISFKRG